MSKAMRYWFQIRLMTDPVRGYFVNVGVAVFDVATHELRAELAPWAPEQASGTVRRLRDAATNASAALASFAAGEFEDPPQMDPLGALMNAMGHCGERIRCGPLLGMTTREPVEKLLATTYQLMVA